MRVLLLAAILSPLQGEVLLKQSGFCGCDSDWMPWSAREETMPRVFVDTKVGIGDSGSLAINGASKAAAYGGWQRQVDGVKPGEWLRLKAHYKAENVAAENWQVVARLEWLDAKDKRTGEPDYAPWTRRSGDWNELSVEVQAPENTASVSVQFYLANAPLGTVWWDDILLERIAPPAPRKVTIATVTLRPRNTKSREESVGKFIDTVAAKVPANADLIVLPEGISVVGNGKKYTEVAESIPGPTTESLGKIAKQRKAYIVAGIYEREGPAIYNTAVLIDRAGEVAGKYRKVYLPREEVEGGLTPGVHFPVFHTDFGKLGLMICYDVFFSDPARHLTNQGAEIIAMPIWGGDEHLAKARAIENGIYLVTSGYDHPTYIMDPLGERLSQANDAAGSVALSTVDLEKRYKAKWLGEMRTRRLKELRVDVQPPTPGVVR